MTARFYQRYWTLIGEDVTRACLTYLNDRVQFPVGFNDTNVCLIPKCKTPRKMTEIRPISLCNVLYKIISKSLANRMKGMPDKIIAPNQSAFIPGRLISDNLLVASEALHYLKTKTKGKMGWMVVNLDISKVYDRIEWPFLEKMMLRLGFSQKWTNLVMQCVKSVTYRFVLNRDLTPQIIPTRGRRQGDPISPYLFLLCSEAFSEFLRDAEEKKQIKGITICRAAPTVTHLLFVDDSFLFLEQRHRKLKF